MDADSLRTIAVPVILAGQFALLAELRNRYFATYRRTRLMIGLRLVSAVVFTLGLGLPLLLSLAARTVDWGNRLLLPYAALALAIVIHYVFPYRHRIRRIHADHTRRDLLTPGIRLVEQTIALPGHAPRPDLHILHVTDLHGDSRSQMDRIAAAFELLRAGPEPDLVFITGDLGEKENHFKGLLPLLGALPARYGRYFVRGNHDFGRDRPRWLPPLIEANGMVLLANRACYVPALDLTLAGLELPWNRDPLPSSADWRGLRVGLAHAPDCITAFETLGVELAFCGHTHGGKVRLPWLGPMISPSRHGRFFAHEWYERGGCRIYISAGIGYCAGRLGEEGEISRITVTFPAPV